MATAISERAELGKHYSSRNWSKAIRVLDSLITKQCSFQDLCNRAFCYSQLELHKHVIKDCDKALQLEPSLLQAYILKGRALSALGRKQDTLLVLKQGYKNALQQSADLKQLLELEELLESVKQEMGDVFQHRDWQMITASPLGSVTDEKLDEASNKQDKHSTLNGTCDNCHKTSSAEVPQSRESHDCSDESGEKSKISIDKSTASTLQEKDNGSHNHLKQSTDQLSGSSPMRKKSSFKPGFLSKLSSKVDSLSEVREVPKKTKKYTITRISKAKSISLDFRLSRGIAQVNEGNYASAISIFDQILREDPTYPEALIGRGTAYAFQRELDNAIADFTEAIRSNLAAGEAWKRRGQARAALCEYAEAIKDLTKALEFDPDSADILHERGIVNFKYKDFNAAVEDLSLCLKHEKDNKSAYTFLGLALSSLGEYKKAEEAHLNSIKLDKDYLEAWVHLAQFYQELGNHTKALECLDRVLQIDNRFSKAYHLRGLVLHGLGEHRKAIKELSIGLSIENSIECLYLRGSCYHAVGEYRDAVKDYDATVDVELDAVEKFVLQCLAFYQKEIALYTASRVSKDFICFDIDSDIDPIFKEYWCKRLHPKSVCEKVYRQPTLRESLKKGKLKKQDVAITKQRVALLAAADVIGKKIQYECPGFLQNRRQQRMAGLAAIEIAQKVSKAWRAMQAEWRQGSKGSGRNGRRNRRRERMNMHSQNRGGAGCSSNSTSCSFETSSTAYGSPEDRSSGRTSMSWLNLYSLAVRWRQISEPCEPVVWVNRLSEEFNSGFGSHTPMVLGQAKVVRYFPNYERTLNLAKTVIKDKQCVQSKADTVIDVSKDGKLEEIMKAKTCDELLKIIGQDFWVATWSNSTAFEGKQLEGTRITCVSKTGEPGCEFAIRTPCTPARWNDFDAEMTSAWKAVCNAYCGDNYGSTNFEVLEAARDAILRLTYYWYNFMPLARGTAVVGFVVLMGLLLAANMEFEGNIPKGLQVDWEAILNPDAESFTQSVKCWLYPMLKINTAWKDLPDVLSTFPTTGSVVAALSSYND